MGMGRGGLKNRSSPKPVIIIAHRSSSAARRLRLRQKKASSRPRRCTLSTPSASLARTKQQSGWRWSHSFWDWRARVWVCGGVWRCF